MIFYELFTGERPFQNQSEILDQGAVFAQKPSSLRSELTPAYDEWLQRLCTFDPEKRPTAKWALEKLESFLVTPEPAPLPPPTPPTSTSASLPVIDFNKLEPGTQLTQKYVVE